jgi:hypothetical protein
MSPTRSRYRELGLESILFEDNHSHHPKRPPMAEENRDEGAGVPSKMLLEESLVRQRNEMMDNFAQILQRILMVVEASSTNNHFRGVAPFKVQVNFDIPLFEG